MSGVGNPTGPARYVVKTRNGFVVLAAFKRGGYSVTWDVRHAYQCSETQAKKIAAALHDGGTVVPLSEVVIHGVPSI
jgi:hypothetical protein